MVTTRLEEAELFPLEGDGDGGLISLDDAISDRYGHQNGHREKHESLNPHANTSLGDVSPKG
jgi:hypothetical protein